MATPVAWVTIALADLEHYLVAAQVSAINSAALGGAQTDRFTRVMTDVVNRVRLKIESCVTNHVSATALTVPPSMRGGVCLLIIAGMQASIPSLRLSEDQRKEIDTFEKDLEAIADCKLAVEAPVDPLVPGDAQRGTDVELASSTTRKATRDTLRGL